MRDLLRFLQKYSHWFLFLLLEAFCLVLVGRTARYQQSVLLSSAGSVSGAVYDLAGKVTSYFHLKDANEALLDRNVFLEERVALLEKALADCTGDTLPAISGIPLSDGSWNTFRAHVIKNSLNRADNYITLDKGADDGIREDMAVVGASGVVGIVCRTSSGYSLVLPLLNSKSSVSCKIQGSDYFGYLKWEGEDPCYAYLKDLPRHAEFSLGDTVVTSGFSSVFPAGLMVGTVDDMADSHDGLSYLLKVKLATDFGKLGSVRVLARSGQEELEALEEEPAKL